MLRALRVLPGVHWDRLRLVMPDAYVESRGASYQIAPRRQHYSVYRWIEDVVDSACIAATGAPFDPRAIWCPDPTDPSAFDDQLSVSPVDMMLLAAGRPMATSRSIRRAPASTAAPELRNCRCLPAGTM